MKRLRIEDLAKIDYARIMEMYKKQFSNPGSFVFTFVGNIDEEKVKPIIEQYLASLPGDASKTDFVKVPMDVNTGKTEKIFERSMQNPKASVFIASTGKMERSQKNSLVMSIFDQILNILYTEKVREDEGGTYGVSVGGSISRYPEGQTLLQISYDTDPSKAEVLNEIIHRELKGIADNGPRAEDFNKVKEYMLKKITEAVKENGYWLNVLSTKYYYGEDMYSDYNDILKSITVKDIQNFAKELLSQNNEAIVMMMPTENAN